MGYKVWTELANKLDPDTGLIGNNWRMLAEKLGYSTEVILCLESKKTSHGRNTLTLFEEYIKSRDSSVNAVMKALESMERKDALEVLQNSIPEIQRRYDAEMKLSLKMEPQEHSECPPCYSSYTRDSIPHSHHSSFGHFGVPYPHMNPHMNIVGPSHSNAYSNLEHDMPKKINTSAAFSKRVTKGVLRMRDYNHSANHTHMSTNVRGGSMAVQVDRRDNYTSDEIEMGELSGHLRDDPAPMAAVLLRKQYMNPLNHVQRNMMNSQDMSVASEEVVGTSPGFQEPMAPKHGSLKRQNSVESNARQPMNEMQAKKLDSNKKLALNIPISYNRTAMQSMKPQDAFISPSPSQTPTSSSSQNPLEKLQQITGSNSYMPDEKYQSMIEEKNREEMLYNGNRFGSEELFKKSPMSSCQYEAEMKKGVMGQPGGEWFNFKPGVRGHHQVANHLRLMKDQGPRTFPLRSKSLTMCEGGESDSQDHTNLSKSQSMPHDMKPAEYRKAFRHIKVFVTYSAESKRHIQKVLNLCRCIEKNGFTCCMDMYDRRMPTEDKLGWVKERFDEADFILICVSETYINETERGQSEVTESTSDKQLHTDYIYQLMVMEYNQIGRNRRFIPVMLDGTTEEHIPSWLQSTLVYKWPLHFRDLLWFLTKPETRIKAKTLTEQKSSEEEEEMVPDSPPAAAAT